MLYCLSGKVFGTGLYGGLRIGKPTNGLTKGALAKLFPIWNQPVLLLRGERCRSRLKAKSGSMVPHPYVQGTTRVFPWTHRSISMEPCVYLHGFAQVFPWRDTHVSLNVHACLNGPGQRYSVGVDLKVEYMKMIALDHSFPCVSLFIALSRRI